MGTSALGALGILLFSNALRPELKDRPAFQTGVFINGHDGLFLFSIVDSMR